jgi:histidine triad (HIT) family protein
MDRKPNATNHIVFETGAVRAIRPDHPLAPGHLVIEPIEAVESLLALEDELLAELMTAVKRAAEEIVRVHGACRVHTDLGGHSNRLRWHVYSPPS